MKPCGMQRLDFNDMLRFWTALLGERGLPHSVPCVFYENKERVPPAGRYPYHHIAFRLQPIALAGHC
jgi:hypothetical protein